MGDGDRHRPASVPVLLIPAFHGDLGHVVGDRQAALRPGEGLFPGVVVGQGVLPSTTPSSSSTRQPSAYREGES